MRNFLSDFRFRTNRQAGVYRTLAAVALTAALALVAPMAHAEQLSSDAKAAIPHDVQQIIMVDYREMQNSPVAMSLRDHVMPPELKKLQDALTKSGLKVDEDTDALAFASFTMSNPDGKGGDIDQTIGIAQGQFQTREILANFAKTKVKPLIVRNNSIYPMGTSGLSVVFLNQTTMVFGSKVAVAAAVDARDGIAPNFLTDYEMVNNMAAVDSHAIWSLLNAKGTQTMMKSMLAGAAQFGDYDSVKDQMKSSRYTMDFANGVKFDMAIITSDTLTAATVATLLKGMQMLKKQNGTPLEQSALNQTTIDSSAGKLTVDYSSSDSQFASLLTSTLFQSVVK